MHLALLFFGILVANGFCEEYTTKFDNIDLDAIIKNDRLLKNYVDCLLDKGPCTNEGKELRKNVKDALETGCSKCSEKQKEGIKRAIKFVSENRKEWWNELLLKYDADGVYRKRYQDQAAKENVNV